jgi:N-acetylglutamate synthase
MDEATNWAVEALCTAAWPALAERSVAGWRLTYAAGVSRRSNSANPTPGATLDLDAVVDACAQFYRERSLPSRFRILSFLSSGLDDRLVGRGYEWESETRTLCAPELTKAEIGAETDLTPLPDEEWIHGVTAAQGRNRAERETYARILARLSIPVAFAAARNAQGETVSFAYAGLKEGRICIESVATRADHRGRGFARKTVGALMAWGRGQGAQAAVLQVQAENHAAVRLYQGLGFSLELYRYHYRTL